MSKAQHGSSLATGAFENDLGHATAALSASAGNTEQAQSSTSTSTMSGAASGVRLDRAAQLATAAVVARPGRKTRAAAAAAKQAVTRHAQHAEALPPSAAAPIDAASKHSTSESNQAQVGRGVHSDQTHSSAAVVPVKPRRGRPPKAAAAGKVSGDAAKKPTAPSSTHLSAPAGAGSTALDNNSTQSNASAQEKIASESTVVPAKPGQGRPPKAQATAAKGLAEPLKQAVTEHAQVMHPSAALPADAVAPAPAQNSQQLNAISNDATEQSGAEDADIIPVKRGRGRPRKVPLAATGGEPVVAKATRVKGAAPTAMPDDKASDARQAETQGLLCHLNQEEANPQRHLVQCLMGMVQMHTKLQQKAMRCLPDQKEADPPRYLLPWVQLLVLLHTLQQLVLLQRVQ